MSTDTSTDTSAGGAGGGVQDEARGDRSLRNFFVGLLVVSVIVIAVAVAIELSAG